MRLVLYFCFVSVNLASMAQLQIREIVSKEKAAVATKSRISTNPPLSIPFWDDFSTSGEAPDTLKWESGAHVFVNATLGQNPPTYKVATFDGLNAGGLAYHLESEYPGAADSLVSRPLDLSRVSAFNRNTVYLSFFWQAKGHGELPDEDDSLRVQYLASDTTWVTQWMTLGGTSNTTFRQVSLPVDEDRFFHKNFRIKFQAFNNLTGPFDTWHIDYIYLDEGRDAGDTLYVDRSFSAPPTPLFSPFYEIPVSQLFKDPTVYLSQQEMVVSNLDRSANPVNFFYNVLNLTTNTAYYNSPEQTSGGKDPFFFKRIVLQNAFEIPKNNLDSQVIMSEVILNSGDDFIYTNDGSAYYNLRVNDTVRTYYTLHNYFAYDDGIAEFAAGINLYTGQLAIRFVAPAKDTLTHLDIYFPSIKPDANGNPVDLLVWKKLGENNLIRQSYTVQTSPGRNRFNRIELHTPVVVQDTFYVGYQQFTDNFIGIGFDRNNLLAGEQVFFNTDGTWEQNTGLKGALMIRPVFDSTATFILGDREIVPDFNVHLYPNPSSGKITVDGDHDRLEVYNLSGQLAHCAKRSSFYDLSFLSNGIYLLKIHYKQLTLTKKLIIRH